jgi:hypothetical protein
MSARKWVPIVVGIVIFIVVVGAGLVAGLAYVVSKQVHVQRLSPASGQEEFDRLAARFAGQTPYLEWPADEDDDHAEMKVHHELETHGTGSIKSLRIGVWKPEDGKLVQVTLPFWTLRLGGNRSMELHTDGRRALILTVTPDQVDRRGPGLILSRKGSDGVRLLVWTE